MRLLIIHSSYGCDSGCCGHRVEVQAGDLRRFEFYFDHPGVSEEEKIAFAIKMVGEDNLADVDFEKSEICSWGMC